LGEYLFYIDFEGHKNDEAVKEALSELKEMSSFFKILGSYPIW
jgi:prephenate dehydratase